MSRSCGTSIGDVDTEDVLLVVNVADEAEIRTRLAPDPWAKTVWLRGAPEPR